MTKGNRTGVYVVASVIGLVVGLVVADRWFVNAMNDAFSEPSEETLEVIRDKAPQLDAKQAREVAETAGKKVLGKLSFRQRLRSCWPVYLIGTGLGIGAGCLAAACIAKAEEE